MSRDITHTRYVETRRGDIRIQVAGWSDGGVSLYYTCGPIAVSTATMTGEEALALADALVEAARVAGPVESQAGPASAKEVA